jgi:hypothetical protein
MVWRVMPMSQESFTVSNTLRREIDVSPEGLAECVRITSSLCAGLNEEMIFIRPMKEQERIIMMKMPVIESV